jgi:hypothetical protein
MSENSSVVNEGTNGTNKFAFFKAIIPVMIIEYFLVVLIFVYYRRCCCRCCKKEGALEENRTLFDEATGSLSNPTEISLSRMRSTSYSQPERFHSSISAVFL